MGAHKTKGGRRTVATTVAHLRTVTCLPLLPQEHACASHRAVVMAVAKPWKHSTCQCPAGYGQTGGRSGTPRDAWRAGIWVIERQSNKYPLTDPIKSP